MTLSLDVYWSFRSPYCYLAGPRLLDLRATYDLDIDLRPVYPGAVRDKDFITGRDPLFAPYLMRDTVRVAEYLDLPFRWPKPDPVQVDPATRQATEEQPYIHRLTRLGVAAARRGKGLNFVTAIADLLWNGRTQDWHEGDHLARATARAELDLAQLDAEIEANPDEYDAAIAENQAALTAAGHYGVPTLVFDGEPFFGQDRVDLCVWRMQQNGLTARG